MDERFIRLTSSAGNDVVVKAKEIVAFSTCEYQGALQTDIYLSKSGYFETVKETIDQIFELSNK